MNDKRERRKLPLDGLPNGGGLAGFIMMSGEDREPSALSKLLFSSLIGACLLFFGVGIPTLIGLGIWKAWEIFP